MPRPVVCLNGAYVALSIHSRSVSAVALLFLSVACVACTSSTRVLLVRHAEREAGADPDLTPRGQQRAQSLVAVARESGLAGVIRTQFRRSVQTAAPVAAALGLTPIEVPVNANQEPSHAANVAAQIRTTFSGRTVLVVGHTSTIPLIIQQLGLTVPVNISEDEFDNLLVVILTKNRPGQLIRGRYGCPSAASCAGCQACP
jgi:phosphohistidine phosphatase SixA